PAADGAQAAANWLTGLVKEDDQAHQEGPDAGVSLRRFAARRSRDEPEGDAGGRSPTASERPSTARSAISVSLELVKRVGPRLPLIVARRARTRITDPPPPPAKLAVVALGIPAGELIPRLIELAQAEGIGHDRLLAITDSLEFTALRRAGFAFEYVPSPERAAAITNEPYAAFAERRAKAALNGRKRVRRTTL
ncbi:MAG: hypothetical protein ACR2OC_06695, partial [Solirubrobacterales bacterium]